MEDPEEYKRRENTSGFLFKRLLLKEREKGTTKITGEGDQLLKNPGG